MFDHSHFSKSTDHVIDLRGDSWPGIEGRIPVCTLRECRQPLGQRR
jgi:hypothetical protein